MLFVFFRSLEIGVIAFSKVAACQITTYVIGWCTICVHVKL